MWFLVCSNENVENLEQKTTNLSIHQWKHIFFKHYVQWGSWLLLLICTKCLPRWPSLLAHPFTPCSPALGSSFAVCSISVTKDQKPAANVCSSNCMGRSAALSLLTRRIISLLQEVASKRVPLKIAHIGPILLSSYRELCYSSWSPIKDQLHDQLNVYKSLDHNKCLQPLAKTPRLRFLLKVQCANFGLIYEWSLYW